MAEAHSAVAFSFSITHEGWDVNFDREVLNLVWQSGLRSWKKRIARFSNSIHNGVYPAHLWSLWITMTIVAAVHLAGVKVPYDSVNVVLSILPGTDTRWHIIAAALAALGWWLLVAYTLRYTLKLLLMYKGWMYEERGKNRSVSLQTRCWLFVVRIFSGWNTPGLYSFQGSLPKLPVPKLHDTTTTYLRSARPLLDNAKYNRMQQLAQDFENGIGKKLQRYLVLKSWWASNYVSDWWEEYVYLRGRSPLMINSNFYGIDAIMMEPSSSQAARAASAINSLLVYRRLVERQEMQPIMVQGLVPLCSWQYERIFNTTRVPGMETDKIQHWPDSNHIVVYHKGRYFKVVIYKGRILKPCEIEIQLQQILEDNSEPLPGEERLAALTAGDRTVWANARRKFFNNGVNKKSLDLIEKAAFIVTLDEIPYEYDKEDPSKLDACGKNLLHGKGYDRWFDKSFTLCIGTNGRVGFNAEHSWADAAVLCHVWESVIWDEIDSRYGKNGSTSGTPTLTPPSPQRLQWEMRHDCQSTIDTATLAAQKLIEELDLRILVHDAYGKGFMKKCRTSPDAFLQMALQLAYYRDAGKFSLTYEASMTRLYREGRTETVRPCTIESSEWVRAMCSKDKVGIKDKIDLFQKACKQHQLGYQDAMCGKGIDRHLFCLYVVSKYLEVESPFLQEVLSEPWRLSTSQTPHGQTSRMDLVTHPDCISAGGGFGPVVDDGYGVSYIIAGEDMLFFHISNKKNKQTDCHRFAKNIEQAMQDVKDMFGEYSNLSKVQQNGCK